MNTTCGQPGTEGTGETRHCHLSPLHLGPHMCGRPDGSFYVWTVTPAAEPPREYGPRAKPNPELYARMAAPYATDHKTPPLDNLPEPVSISDDPLGLLTKGLMEAMAWVQAAAIDRALKNESVALWRKRATEERQQLEVVRCLYEGGQARADSRDESIRALTAQVLDLKTRLAAAQRVPVVTVEGGDLRPVLDRIRARAVQALADYRKTPPVDLTEGLVGIANDVVALYASMPAPIGGVIFPDGKPYYPTQPQGIPYTLQWQTDGVLSENPIQFFRETDSEAINYGQQIWNRRRLVVPKDTLLHLSKGACLIMTFP